MWVPLNGQVHIACRGNRQHQVPVYGKGMLVDTHLHVDDCEWAGHLDEAAPPHDGGWLHEVREVHRSRPHLEVACSTSLLLQLTCASKDQEGSST